MVALGKLAWRAYQLRRLSKSGINEIDRMDGHRFEEYLSTLFRRLGYRVELTRRRGDYGADLVVTKGKTRTAVQAKRWSKNIGVKAVQEAVASKAMHSCDSVLVVANREFTKSAQKLARANKVELWGREVLVSKLLSARGREAPPAQLEIMPPPPTLPAITPAPAAASAAASRTETSSPPPAPVQAASEPATCVTCGATVSEKVRDYCIQHSQRFGGRIYCFKHQRGVRSVPATDWQPESAHSPTSCWTTSCKAPLAQLFAAGRIRPALCERSHRRRMDAQTRRTLRHSSTSARRRRRGATGITLVATRRSRARPAPPRASKR